MSGPAHHPPGEPLGILATAAACDDGAEPGPSDPFNEDGDAPAELMRDLAGLPPDPAVDLPTL